MRILAFDPGIENMGWSVLEVDSPNENIRVIDYGTLLGNEVYKTQDKTLKKKFKKPFVILQGYKPLFKDLIEKYNPDAIVSEGAFAHRFIAAAFSLITVIHVLRQTCYDTKKMDLNLVAPMQTKSILTGKYMANKEEIEYAINHHKNISLPKKDTPPSEHGYDSIGHGYAYIQMKILHPELYPDKKSKKSNKRQKK